ncbi:MAG: tyrosine--tRNA ligase [Spirochaetales bacterium]|nr:tyrosine--tRNA ligase [Spirochaetales bacterium]
MNKALELLKERGFFQQCTDEALLEKKLNEGPVRFYAGFDPTGPSLHCGHLVPLFAMAHLQGQGHLPIALVGGATARIGDPSGKIEMRKMLSVEQIQANAESLKRQISRFIEFDNDKALLLDNADWLVDLNYLDFLRTIGRHFSVNRMLTFESYKKRLETGLTFIEFNYQLLQSYDFLVLRKKHNCFLQIGGDDQWGNIVAGMELIRRVDGLDAAGLTFPLVTRSDGKKMGKTEKGAVFLDPNQTSVYDFFQYWRNVADADVEKFLKLYTFLPIAQCIELGRKEGAEINSSKEILAYELTKIIHGQEEADKALAAARAAFVNGATGDLEGMPSIEIEASVVAAGINVLDLFAQTSLCKSKGEARRLVDQGGAVVSDKKIESVDAVIDSSSVVDGNIILKAGKKRFFRVVVK